MAGSVICVVQARTGSARLPGKVLMDLDGRSMLRFMLDRLAGLRVDDLVVATSNLARDDAIADVAAAAGVACVRGPESDVLSRFGAVLDTRRAEVVVRLTADCPLTDPRLVEAVVERRLERDAEYACNVLPRTFPKGLDVEVITADALRQALRAAKDPDEREHVTPYLYRHPEVFRLANLRSGDDLGDERWTVDTPDDLAFVRSAVERMDGTDFGWRDLLAVIGRTSPPRAGLHLRAAQRADAELLLALRNDPDSVRFSKSGRAVHRDEHASWLHRHLDDGATRMWIGVEDERSIGSIRVDVVDATGEVSLAVATGERGRGRGGALVRLLQTELENDLQVMALTARVHPRNTASLRLFKAAGFTAGPARDGGFHVLEWTKMGAMEGRR